MMGRRHYNTRRSKLHSGRNDRVLGPDNRMIPPREARAGMRAAELDADVRRALLLGEWADEADIGSDGA